MTRASDLAKLLGAGATILDGTTITTADNTDQLTLISTDADANVGPNLNLFRNSGSPADDDVLGLIIYNGRNDNSQDVIYARQISYIKDASDGTEDGQLTLQTMVAGTIRDRLNINPTEIALNEDSQDLDFRVESNGNANMLFVNGGTDRVGIGTSSPATTFEVTGSSTLDDILLTTVALPGAGVPSIALRNTDNNIYHQSGSGNSIIFIDSSQNTMYNISSNTHIFNTGNAERMRIDSSGRVLMGSNSTVFDTDQVLHISGTQGCNMRATVESVGGSVLNLQRSDTTEGDFLRIINSSNAETGQIKVNSSGTTVFENVSDYRLKDNIKDWTVDAIAKVKQIKIRTFDWKDQTAQTNGKDVIGVIAHELQEVYSYCVSGEKDGYGEDVDKDGNKKPMYQGVDYGKLTPLLTKALQEQQATIEALTARIVTLEGA